MTTGRLSDARCDAAQGPPADGKRAYVIYYDRDVKGFGLRVTRAGAKSFVLNYRIAGTERRYTLGTYRDSWRTTAPRKEALRLKQEIDQGKDPQDEKHKKRTAPTVNELVDRWRAEHAPKNRASSVVEDEGLVRQWIKPALGSRKVADIRRRDIVALHRKITDRGTTFRANRVLSLVSTLLAVPVEEEWIDVNPARGIKRNAEPPRYRYLETAELSRLIKVLAELPNRQLADVVTLLLLTGSRKSEVLTASWVQFNLDAGVWTKPAANVKTGHEHRLPLSAPAIELLIGIKERQLREVEVWNSTRRPGQPKRSPSRFVFPAAAGGDRPLPDIRSVLWKRLIAKAGLEGVRIHDLRHSYASLLVSAGLTLPVIGDLLGHAKPATTARHTHLFDEAARAAAGKVAEAIAKATLPPAAVVPLPRK